jgi:hypothetical protein
LRCAMTRRGETNGQQQTGSGCQPTVHPRT